MNEVLDRVLLTMQEQRLSAKELCERTGISQSTFATWKSKDREPKPSQLSRIAEALSVSVEFLLNGGEEMERPYYLNEETEQAAQEIFENPELRALFRAARGSSAEDLKLAHDMLLALKRKERGE